MVAQRVMTHGCQPSNFEEEIREEGLGCRQVHWVTVVMGSQAINRVKDMGHLLKEASLVLLFIVRSKLDLALEACKFTGLVKGDRVGAIQDVISCLENTRGNSVWVQGYPC